MKEWQRTCNFPGSYLTIQKKIANRGYVPIFSKLTKQKNINFVFKIWNYWIVHDLLWYCQMSSEIIQSVAYDNYVDF
jgi:hypothetical protein